jgi:hypothetical protein
MDEFYVFLSSEDSHELYPDNTANYFTVNFKKSIQLNGDWSVGLAHMKCQFESVPSIAHIECDICGESYISNAYRPLLNVVYPKFRKYVNHFTNVLYMPVTTNVFNKITISIREGGTCINTSYCVLHFKKNGTLEKSFSSYGTR